jgi:tetratricopeptide (TPR) repeat protein
MAKVNPVKLKQDADKLEKAGKLEQAIVLYRQIVEDSPRDWNTINKIGDLLAKLNKFQEANEEYAKVADFYAKDGFHLKAIAIWKKINKLDPSSLGAYVALAELYAKQGLMMEAKGQYQIVVEEHIKRGKMRDAGEILRKMAEIDPADLKVRSKLADLYTREGNSSRAVEEHVAIAEELSKKGHLAEAVQVLDKGLKIDPRSLRLRVELGRVYLVQRNFERAVPVLEEAAPAGAGDPLVLARLGEAYLGAGRTDDAERLYRRLIELNPEDAEARAQMGRVHIVRRELERALEEFTPLIERYVARRQGDLATGLLQEIVQREPGHVKTLVKLAEVHRLLRQDNAVVATYSQLTEAYLQAGDYDQAIDVLDTLVSMEPYNQQHKTKLQFVRDRRASAGGAPLPPSAGGEMDVEFELTGSDEEFPGLSPAEPRRPAPPATPTPLTVPVVASPSAPPRPRIVLSGPLSDHDQEFVDEHLAEGKVFRKYGLIDKAADQFEAVVARFADHVEARQELRDIYKEKGQLALAAAQAVALAEIARLKGDAAGAEQHEAQARELAPPSAAPEPPPAPAVSAPPDEAEEIPLTVEEEEREDEEEVPLALEDEATDELPEHFLEEEEQPLDEPPATPELADAIEAPSALDLAFDLPAGAPAEPIAAAPAQEDESPFPIEAADGDLSAEADEAGFEFPFEEEEAAPEPAAPLPVPPPVRAAGTAPAPPAATAALPAELRRVLDEVDEYLALGFVEDARDALLEIAPRHPTHALVLAKLAELGLDAGGAESAEPAQVEGPAFEAPDDVERPEPAAVFGGTDALLGADLDFDLPAATAPTETAGSSVFADELEFPGLGEAAPEPEPAAALEDAEDLLAPPPVSVPDSVEEMLAAEWEAPPAPEPATPPAPESPLQALEAAVGALPADEEPLLDLGAELFGAVSAVEEPPREAPAELGEAGLADIFREFKKGVDRQLGQEDYDTRYNLGIAYKEMGLVDEAIAEFQLAAKDPARLLECASMLGICFLEKGMPKLAVKWFEKGLQAPGRSEEEYQGLRYDLACAYENDGEAERARELFAELFGHDAQFRDVAERLRALSRR